MKKFSVVALVLAIAVVFTGCTSNEMKLYKAMTKTQDITSMESDVNVDYTLEFEGFPEEEQQQLQQVVDMLKDSGMNIHQKIKQNKEKTVSQAEVKMGFNFGGMKTDAQAWVDVDMSGDKPKMLEIIKMPPLLMGSMPQETSVKEYIVYDFEEMMNLAQEEQEEIDFKEMMNFSKEMQPKIIEFMKGYAKKFKPGFEIAKFKGKKTVKGKALSMYEVKLDDKAFKELIRYIGNNFMENEENIKFFKEYMDETMKLVKVPEMEKKEQIEEVNKGLEEFKNQRPELKKQFNEFMDTLKDVKILGEKGIVVEYGVNNDGYIVNEDCNMDINIDLAAIGKAFKQEDLANKKGVLKLGLNINSKNYNINKDIKINMPELNEENSLNFKDIMEQTNSFEDQAIEESVETIAE